MRYYCDDKYLIDFGLDDIVNINHLDKSIMDLSDDQLFQIAMHGIIDVSSGRDFSIEFRTSVIAVAYKRLLTIRDRMKEVY